MSKLGPFLPLVIALVLNATANVLMKIGAVAPPHSADASLFSKILGMFNGVTILAISLFAINILCYRRALENLNLTIAYPIMVALGLVLVTLASVFLPRLHEQLTPLQIGGMVFIIIGVVMLASR